MPDLADASTAELEFGRHHRTGTVHVLVPLRDGDGSFAGTTASAFSSWLWVRTLCGRVPLVADIAIVEVFDDNRICGSCHTLFPADHVHRLFVHLVPDDL